MTPSFVVTGHVRWVHAIWAAMVLAGWLGGSSIANAETALDLIAGFDADRVETAGSALVSNQPSEAAKLVYRLHKIPAPLLAERATQSIENAKIGDAVYLEGVLRSKRTIPLVWPLDEQLGFSALQVIQLDSSSLTAQSPNNDPLSKSSRTLTVASAGLPDRAATNDRLAFNGVLIGQDPLMIAAPKIQWFPKQSVSDSWRWLSEQGMDIGLLPLLADRDRLTLEAKDSDAFYSLLAAASFNDGHTAFPDALPVETIDLLSDPKIHIGQFVSIVVETVQITRVEISETVRQEQIGNDHYYQIDAMGRLDNTVVKIETGNTQRDNNLEDTPEAVFENRFPVSIVASELPSFLVKAMRDRSTPGSSTSSDSASSIRMQVKVDGFFFRLWSYSSQYMQRFGDGKQFGPLLMASRIRNLQPVSTDPVGVGVIGWIAAIAVILGITGVLFWNWQNGQADRRARHHNRDRQPTVIEVPRK